MKKLLLTLLNLNFLSFAANAQVSGSSDVCPANVYSYSASIAGATSYTWTLPSGWYNVSGQGTATISAVCNMTDGNVCAEGFNSGGTSLGTVCLQTTFGGGGSGWDVMPPNSDVCNGGGPVSLSLVPNGTGGSCPNGCGNGIPVPNLQYCIYDNPWPTGNWVAFVNGGSFFSAGGVYYIYQCDVSAGNNPPQAVRIEGGCAAATINNVASVTANIPIPPYVYQTPLDPCIGDTVVLNAMGTNPCWGCLLMITGMNLLSPQFGSSAYFEITSLPASADVSAIDMNGCLAADVYTVTTGICSPNCLVGSYALNGNAADSSGNNQDGTLSGCTPTFNRNTTPYSALHFDGINDRIDLPNDFDFPQRTWSLWFYADTITTAVSQIIDDDHANLQYAQTEIFLREINGVDNLYMSIGDNATGLVTPVNEKQWYHIALVRDANKLRYYINGCIADSVTIAASFNNHSQDGLSTVSLGVGRFHNNNYFKGILDDVKIYQCALSDSEINILADTLCNPLFVKEQSNAFQKIFIYPSPANSHVIISSAIKTNSILQIVNAAGQVVFEDKNFAGNSKIDISKFKQGVYFVKVNNEQVKFVKL